MNSLLVRGLLATLLLFASAALPYLTSATGAVANHPDRSPLFAALLVTLAGGAWLLLARATSRALGATGAFLLAPGAVVALAAATAIGAADCYYDACPYAAFFGLFWVLVLGYPLAVFLLALGFRNDAALPLGYLALTLPYAVVMFFAGALMPSVQRLLAAVAPYALLYTLHRLALTQPGGPGHGTAPLAARPTYAILSLYLLRAGGAIAAIFFLFIFVYAVSHFDVMDLLMRMGYVPTMVFIATLLLWPTLFAAGAGLSLLVEGDRPAG